MAIYRLSAQVISRASGRSATAAAAYRSGGRIADQRTGQVHDYERRSGVVHEEIMAPPNTPEWMLDREALWNAVEQAEKRKDAQLCREIQLALPHELDRQNQLELVREFAGQEFVARGMIADVAFHESHRKGDPRNEHVHVMLTLREIAGDGFGRKDRSWNERALIGHWREQWAEHVNRALERAGHQERVDHRTLEAQRIVAERQAAEARAANDNEKAATLEIEAVILDREPEPKIGHIATALERQGMRTERGDLWRSVVASNLARLHNWFRLQQDRLATTWGLVQALFDRTRTRSEVGSPQRTAPRRDRSDPPSYSQEERDRLLGKKRPDERRDLDRSRDRREKGRDDDRER